jgi:uncharacterized membrane protein
MSPGYVADVSTFDSSPSKPAGLTPVLERNIQTLLERRAREEQSRGLQDKIADTVTRFTGTMTFVYIHVALVGTWIFWNSSFSPFPRFDESLVMLAMLASVEAIFLSTFILITQNRLTALANKRADLDLQISLLAEHEITRMMDLVTAMAQKMGIEDSHSPDLQHLRKDVAPEKVLDKLEESYRKTGAT